MVWDKEPQGNTHSQLSFLQRHQENEQRWSNLSVNNDGKVDGHESSPLKENPLKEDGVGKIPKLENTTLLEGNTRTLQDIAMSNQILDKTTKA